MAGAKNHQYHILPPSIWPFLGSFSALAMALIMGAFVVLLYFITIAKMTGGGQ